MLLIEDAFSLFSWLSIVYVLAVLVTWSSWFFLNFKFDHDLINILSTGLLAQVLDATDHVNSCKPVNQTDPSYAKTLEFLKRLKSRLSSEESE